jgi:hypothetical protein
MSQASEPDVALRRSLDAIDSLRRRVMWSGYLAVATTAGAFFWLDYIARTRDDLESLIMAAVFAITSVVAWTAFALAIFIVRMTKRILRAIDLTSKA